MGTELDAQIEIEFIVHPDEGPMRVVTHPAHILRRWINQPRLPGIGRLKIRILWVHKCFDVGAAMPVAGLTSDTGHFRGLLDGNEAAYQAISGGVARQAD